MQLSAEKLWSLRCFTVALLRQARDQLRLMISGAEMMHAPKGFFGTSGVTCFDRPATADWIRLWRRNWSITTLSPTVSIVLACGRWPSSSPFL